MSISDPFIFWIKLFIFLHNSAFFYFQIKGCGRKSVYFQRIASIWYYTDLFPHPLINNQMISDNPLKNIQFRFFSVVVKLEGLNQFLTVGFIKKNMLKFKTNKTSEAGILRKNTNNQFRFYALFQCFISITLIMIRARNRFFNEFLVLSIKVTLLVLNCFLDKPN